MMYQSCPIYDEFLVWWKIRETLPLHLKAHFAEYNMMVTVTMTIGSIFSVLLQLWLGKRTEHFKPQNVIFIAYLLFATGAVGLGLAPHLAVLVLFYLVLCLGSMLVQTHFNKMISVWAPVDMRGRFFFQRKKCRNRLQHFFVAIKFR